MSSRTLAYFAIVCSLIVSAANAAPKPPRSGPSAPYNFGLPYRVTDLVNMSIAFNNQHRGHIVVALFGKTVPKAAENFKALCSGREGFGYVNSSFHRVLRDFIVQGGDFEHNNGKGGYSVFQDNPGRRFSAENYNCPHRQGSVAMASESRTRLGSQFYFVVGKEGDVRFLNGKHVVFGHVVSGFKTVVAKMGRAQTTRQDQPRHPMRITGCTTSVYVDPQDNLNQPPKKILIDDDAFGETKDAAGNHHEGPKKPSSNKGAAKREQKKAAGAKGRAANATQPRK